ncbi:hypothetical protein V6N13_051442 [Hibiscus sabdariffa]|uniref:Secreted protein n=1 Tax=Hibiscus sabdariffa TaxID=183260 RepID=A0ABR2T3D1_9ROSI
MLSILLSIFLWNSLVTLRRFPSLCNSVCLYCSQSLHIKVASPTSVLPLWSVVLCAAVEDGFGRIIPSAWLSFGFSLFGRRSGTAHGPVSWSLRAMRLSLVAVKSVVVWVQLFWVFLRRGSCSNPAPFPTGSVSIGGRVCHAAATSGGPPFGSPFPLPLFL